MTKYRLFAFNVRGRAEVIRQIFAVAGQEYEDNRFEHSEWNEMKAKSPFGNAPWLEIIEDEQITVLAQSTAIARYLARKYGLAGNNELEMAQIEMYADQITDLLVEMITALKEEDQSRQKQLKEKLEKQSLPHNLKLFDNRLAVTGSGFFASSGLSYADLQLLTVLDFLAERKDELLVDYKHVKMLDEKIRSHPAIASWLAKRPNNEY